MGDKRGSDYINLGALYGAPRPETVGLPRPDPTYGPVFVSHEETLRRELAIINARIAAELGPLPPDGLSAVKKPRIDAKGRPLLPLEPTDYPTTQEDAMRLDHVAAMAAITAAMAACEPAQTEIPQREGPSIPDSGSSRNKDEKVDIASAVNAISIEAVVNQVMNQQYGDTFNPELGCWEHTIEVNEDRRKYCMKSSVPQVIPADNGRRLFFFSYSKSNISNSSEYIYGLNDPGLMGAFEVFLKDGKWKLLAASRSMDFGSSGDCNCEFAKLIKLGNDYYGWIFSSGTTWQGISLIYHNLVAPRGGTFEDLSEIPMIEEEAGAAEYQIKIDDSRPEEKVFPLILTKTSASKTERFKIDFDYKKWRYVLPKYVTNSK